MHAACAEGHDEIVRYLIENGAPTQSATRSGDRPVMGAAAHGHCEVVRLLHQAGANVRSSRDGGGSESTPYALAYRNGRREVVNYLRSSCDVAGDIGRGRVRQQDEFANGARVVNPNCSSPPSSPAPN